MSMHTSIKRAREQYQDSASSSRSSTSSPTSTGTPTAKAQRIANHAAPLLCTLPPTCHPPHNAPTALANSQELEAHYAKFHAYVCEDRACAAVFPDARLLALHQTECHDPLALVRKERGEKIFACHLETCSRLFLDPKKRRMHLIQAHGYPKEYFFAVTNKGVGGLLKKWGEGASLLRRPWKARDGEGIEAEVGDEHSGDDDDESRDEEMLSAGTVKNAALPPADPRKLPKPVQKADHTREQQSIPTPSKIKGAQRDELDALTNSLDSLSLVPQSIRFGRGGKSGRIVRQSQARNCVKQTMKNHPLGDAADPELIMNNEANMLSSDGGVSINIDAALEALKSEAASNVTVKQSETGVPYDSQTGSRNAPVLGRGRGRGGRGRGRGRGRGQRRGRG